MQLVPTPIQADLYQAAVVDIPEGVRSGLIVGLCVVAQLRGGHFFVDVFGRTVKQPWDARGWVRSLDDCLREIGEQRRERGTTR